MLTNSFGRYCPWCNQDLTTGPLIEAQAHVTKHLEDVRESHPEVPDEQLELDPQDGAENLAPIPRSWRKEDFSKNLGNEETE